MYYEQARFAIQVLYRESNISSINNIVYLLVLFIQSNGNSQFSINVLKYNILTDVSSSNVVRVLTRELQGDFGNSSHIRDNKKYYKKGDYYHKRKTIQKTNDKTKASKGYSPPKAICSNHFFRPRYNVIFLETTFINYFK